MNKQAIIFGATGAVGLELLELCLKGDRYQKVTVIARRAAPVTHSKLDWVEAELDDLNDLESVPGLVGGDAYCCLGTTIKAAGSAEKFHRVDFGYVVGSARYSKKCTVRSFSMISAIGADPHSRNLYNRTKGEAEQAVISEKLPALRIFRPSLLKGKREDFRLAEQLGNFASILLRPVFFFGFKQYQPIEISKVARGIYSSIEEDMGDGMVRVYESDQIQGY